MDIQLGFCKVPEPIYIYVKKEEIDGKACLWYQLDHETSKQIGIEHRAIAGYLRDIRVTVKEFKSKENVKLELVVNADETYIIRSGIETNFSKSILLALSQISDFSKPLIFAVQAGNENVVFGRLYDAEIKQRISSEWNSNADFYGIINKIENALGKVSVLDINPKPETEIKINAEQAKRLWAIARKECKLDDDDVRSVFARFNIESTTDIPASRYEAVIDAIRNFEIHF